MTETVAFERSGTLGEIEFRNYPELVIASVNDTGDDRGFNHLFRYITGNNRTKGTISMTSPVISSEKVAMTSPVLSRENSMSFVMPSGKKPEDLPDPLDAGVHISTIAAREIAVLRFRGYARKNEVEGATSRLLEGLKKAGITTKGRVFLMRYDPPWTPGFLRRNEIGIEILR